MAKTKQATRRRSNDDGKAPKRSRAKKPTGAAVESVDITPTPRILKVLGEIEFAPWQCIAELVDNSFDEFLSIKRSGPSWKEPFEVSVDIPAPSAKGPDDAIAFSDNGRGMTLGQVTNAAKAGWTANDPFSKLGLFGMGFNVATARLGKVTRLLTTRAGDPEWVGLEIDLDNLGEDFAAPIVRRKKSSQNEHGTRVEVAGLDPRSDWLRRPANHRKLRETLGGVYGYLLQHEDFRLSVNGVAVEPVRHCVWDPDRSVTRRKEVIPAVIEIDKSLPDRAVCHDCSTWQDVGNKTCDECGGENMEVRERRIWGWVGIQRDLDNKEFGIDFLRNGRKILRFDKSLFQWNDPDDPAAQGDVEYPIELPANQGRIVGEIHLDHVPVIYTKDAFDKGDRGWRIAVKTVRGDGPLLPEAAKRAGYDPSDAPLARLHRGYRRNDPGKNYLTPGNGKTLINNLDWKKKFQAGDPEYQDDHIWWEAVVRHDEIKAAEKKAKEDRERAQAEGLDDPTTEFEGGAEEGPGPEADTEEQAEAGPKTERERVDALVKQSTVIPELDAQFSATGIPGQPMKLTAYGVSGEKVTVGGKRVPVWLASAKRGSFAAFVDLDHPHFQEFDDDPEDLVLQEVAAHLIARTTGETPPFSAVFASLKERYLASRTINEAKLDALATQMLTDLKDRMVTCVEDNPERPWRNALNAAEREITQDRVIRNLRVANVDPLIEDGSYLRHVPSGVIPRVVEEWPEAFFDGRLFESPYAEIESPSARRGAVSLITGYLDDLSWLAESPHHGRREQLIRARLSLQLLPDELVDAPE
jgi:hypothetical protein